MSNNTTLAMAIGLVLTTLSTTVAAGEIDNPFSVHETPGLALQGRAVNGPDSDGDGIRNQDDLDDDNDGTPDVLDLDSDNDGILDIMEAPLLRDAGKALDRVPNGAIDIGILVGSNGIADEIGTSPDSGIMKFALPDTDQDGIPDFRDLDSDGDGIYDLVEAGGPDADQDGRIDQLADADGDGIPDRNDVDVTGGSDVDNDGIDDAFDVNFVDGADADGDGVVDSHDPDVDGDGVPDLQQGPALSGGVETGLDGTGFGCSVATTGRPGTLDPLLPLLFVGSLVMLFTPIRRRALLKSGS